METEHSHGPECYEKGKRFVDELKAIFKQYCDVFEKDNVGFCLNSEEFTRCMEELDKFHRLSVHMILSFSRDRCVGGSMVYYFDRISKEREFHQRYLGSLCITDDECRCEDFSNED